MRSARSTGIAPPFSRRPAADEMRTMTLKILIVGVLAGLVGASCGGSSDTAKPDTAPTAVTIVPTTVTSPPTTTLPPYISFVAQVNVPKVNIYSEPNAPTPLITLENPWQVDPAYPKATVQQVFLVEDRSSVPGWVKVLLPIRPNGTIGWLRTTDVALVPVSYHIRVELGAHRITVTDADQVLYQGPVAVGTAQSPTPTGRFYLRVLIQAPDPTTVYGPYAYGLSSHSEVYSTFNGGDGEVGIHGNNDASVLGRDVTHGCIRVDNAAITQLAATLPLGTPVDVVA
jgi:lipoprotein-anchoring transpeptidase ErfK/SrfK